MGSTLQPTAAERQLYVLNMLANINSDLIVKGTGKSAVETLVTSTKSLEQSLQRPEIQKVIGEWELVWGPYISYSEMQVDLEKYANLWAEFQEEVESHPLYARFLEQENDLKADQEEDGAPYLQGLADLLTGEALDVKDNKAILPGGDKHLVTDNTMYVVRCKKHPEGVTDGPDYFIGIAETNTVSPYGWFKEDFDVSTTKAWKEALSNFGKTLPDEGQISTASWRGLQQLWNLGRATPQPVPGDQKERGYAPEGEKSLWEFVSGLAGQQNIAISGHSLGGALSPVLGTALADLMAAQGGSHNIQVLTTAGPTPGNQAFVDHFSQLVPDYSAIYNEIDVVPQAWIDEDLAKAVKFYPASFGFKIPLTLLNFSLSDHNPIVEGCLNWAVAQANHQYARKGTAGQNPIKTWNEGRLELGMETKLLFIGAGTSLSLYLELFHRGDLRTISTTKRVSLNLIRVFSNYLIYLGWQHRYVYHESKGFDVEDAIKARDQEMEKFRSKFPMRILDYATMARLILSEILSPFIQNVAKWAAA